MIAFEKKNLETLNIEEFYNFKDKLIFQTVPWINFIVETQHAEPIILQITDDGKLIGYFTGFLFKKFGLRIIGSPFRGWTTIYMGFNFVEGFDRASVVKPLWSYLKKEYRCVYCEIIDRFITEDEAKENGLIYDLQGSYCIDISGTEDELLSRFSKRCRKQIRNAEKRDDINITYVEPTDEFAEEYFQQLSCVFGYQELIPSYDLARVKCLLENLKTINSVLCLKALTDEGQCVGTSISFGYGSRCYTWGSTSLRGKGLDHLQSEGLRWEMMKYWRSKEAYDYDMVGIRKYKTKFNPYEIQVPRIIMTKFRTLIWGRNLAQKLYWFINSIKGKKRFMNIKEKGD